MPLGSLAATLITVENAKPGTANWAGKDAHSRVTDGYAEIEGYASLTSVNRGGQIAFYINTPETGYTLTFFRLGWYGGKGARLMAGPIHRTGMVQQIPEPDPATGLVDCHWQDPYILTVPTNAPDADGWVSGIYIAQARTDQSQREVRIGFVVREDRSTSTYLFQVAATTPQAYNLWGGGSLYNVLAAPLFKGGEITNLHSLASRLLLPGPTDSVSRFLDTRLSATTSNLLAGYTGSANPPLEQALVTDLNQLIQGTNIYDAARFSGITLSPTTHSLLEDNVQGMALTQLNRMLLEDAYPMAFVRNDSLTSYSTGRAYMVSFNRPFDASWHDVYSEFERKMLRFLEREGYDVSYCSNLDIHEQKGLPLQHRVFLSVGHDEYWSWEMRENVENARDQGASLAFFSANTCYWQVRLAPSSATGDPDRTIICYKDKRLDPISANPDPQQQRLATVKWRENAYSVPEDALLGVYYQFYPVLTNLVIFDASHWVCSGTGLTNGSLINGVVGYEADGLGTHTPPGTAIVGLTPVVGIPPHPSGNSAMTVYTAPSGADVFASGTIEWSYGLEGTLAQTAAQQMTRNVLSRLARCYPAQKGMVSWWAADGNGKDELGRNDGILPGGISYRQGEAGLAFEFDGLQQALVVTNVVPTNSFTSELSIDAWLNPARFTTEGSTIFATQGAASIPWAEVALDATGHLVVHLTTVSNSVSANLTCISSVAAARLGEWQHLAVTVNLAKDRVSAYIDGQDLALGRSGTILTGGSFPQANALFLGALPLTSLAGAGIPPLGHYYAGLLDEIGLYGRALSASEIGPIFASGAGGRCGDAPRLTITRQSTADFVSWPVAALGFNLQSATNVSSPFGWRTETNLSVIDGVTFRFPSRPVQQQQFFRLQRSFW